MDVVRHVHAGTALTQYIVDLVAATRTTTALRLGASPRATLHLLRAARATAAMQGRDHVLPQDVRGLLVPVLAHRVLLSGESRLARRDAAAVLDELMSRVPLPTRLEGP